jgi:tRNA(fMet)-specific endonuclease VapC
MLDTNICIYLLTGQPKKVFDRLARQDQGSVVMSCLTLAELEHGVQVQSNNSKLQDQAALESLLSDIPALPFDHRAARAFGVLAGDGKLRRNQAVNNLIAAHAISQDAVLVTNNENDFKSYSGLKVENWA